MGSISTDQPIAPASSTNNYRIASIPADGIGPEVISAGIEVLQTLAKVYGNFSFDFTHFGLVQRHLFEEWLLYPARWPRRTQKVQCNFFSVLLGDLRVPDHVSLWGLRLAICQPLQQYANVRPTRVLKGVKSPLSSCQGSEENTRKLDWVIIRENSEGEYAGQGGRSHIGQPWETATEVSIFTRPWSRTYHALCLRNCQVSSEEEADLRDKVQRPA